jgi:hypothetical protein
LLGDGLPLARDGALALLDRGDQLILAHPRDAGDTQLAGQLTEFSHHHSGQPSTATRRCAVVGSRHRHPGLVGRVLIRRGRSSNIAAQHIDFAHAGPS